MAHAPPTFCFASTEDGKSLPLTILSVPSNTHQLLPWGTHRMADKHRKHLLQLQPKMLLPWSLRRFQGRVHRHCWCPQQGAGAEPVCRVPITDKIGVPCVPVGDSEGAAGRGGGSQPRCFYSHCATNWYYWHQKQRLFPNPWSCEKGDQAHQDASG